MNWEEVLKAWGIPALVGALTGIGTLLLNRRLPFQQNLNEAQLRHLSDGFNAIVVSTRAFVDQLHRVIFAYEAAREEHPDEDHEVLRQAFFESFLIPEFIGPVQEMMFLIVTPDEVLKSLAEYQVAMAAIPSAAMNLVDTVGAEVAWQTMMNESNRALHELARTIRETLGVNDLTAMNRYHAQTTMHRFKMWFRRKVNRALRRAPASAYESLIFSTQMAKMRAAVEADLGSGSEQPIVEDLLQGGPVIKPEDHIDRVRARATAMRVKVNPASSEGGEDPNA